MENKRCYQWVVSNTGMSYQPECSKGKCMWWRKCNKATVELELPDEILYKLFGVEKS